MKCMLREPVQQTVGVQCAEGSSEFSFQIPTFFALFQNLVYRDQILKLEHLYSFVIQTSAYSVSSNPLMTCTCLSASMNRFIDLTFGRTLSATVKESRSNLTSPLWRTCALFSKLLVLSGDLSLSRDKRAIYFYQSNQHNINTGYLRHSGIKDLFCVSFLSK